MHSKIFNGWSKNHCSLTKQKTHYVTVGTSSLSWFEVHQHAQQISKQLIPNQLYFIDVQHDIKSIIALLAVSLTSGASFIWGKKELIVERMQHISCGIYSGLTLPLTWSNQRVYYGSFSSGSTIKAKISMGYAESLELIGLHYDKILLLDSLGEDIENGITATSLPLEYSATLMMAIFPAWFNCRNLVLFKPDNWHFALTLAKRKPMLVLTVPSLLSAACAAIISSPYPYPLYFLTTGGYLTPTRIQMTLRYFPEASYASCYGSSEYGVISINKQPDQFVHAGQVITGKSLWLSEMNECGIGKLNSDGADCRYAYFGNKFTDEPYHIEPTDFGHFDSENNLYLDGRIDGAEKLNGLLIYPRQIERHLMTLPNILDVKIRIQSDLDKGSQYLGALVVGDINEQDVRVHCYQLPSFMQPREIRVINELNAVYSSRGKL